MQKHFLLNNWWFTNISPSRCAALHLSQLYRIDDVIELKRKEPVAMDNYKHHCAMNFADLNTDASSSSLEETITPHLWSSKATPNQL